MITVLSFFESKIYKTLRKSYLLVNYRCRPRWLELLKINIWPLHKSRLKSFSFFQKILRAMFVPSLSRFSIFHSKKVSESIQKIISRKLIAILTLSRRCSICRKICLALLAEKSLSLSFSLSLSGGAESHVSQRLGLVQFPLVAVVLGQKRAGKYLAVTVNGIE